MNITYRLETPVLDVRGSACVEFGLHMTGRDAGSLSVLTLIRGEMPWARRNGDQGSDWIYISQSVTLSNDDKVTVYNINNYPTISMIQLIGSDLGLDD